MDLSLLPVILGAIGACFGAFATIQQQRSSNVNKRMEMLLGFQDRTVTGVQKENEDLRARLALAEKNIMQCEKDKHIQDLRILDLEHLTAEQARLIEELRGLIPNGTSL